MKTENEALTFEIEKIQKEYRDLSADFLRVINEQRDLKTAYTAPTAPATSAAMQQFATKDGFLQKALQTFYSIESGPSLGPPVFSRESRNGIQPKTAGAHDNKSMSLSISEERQKAFMVPLPRISPRAQKSQSRQSVFSNFQGSKPSTKTGKERVSFKNTGFEDLSLGRFNTYSHAKLP